MLDLKRIRETTEELALLLRRRDPSIDLAPILDMDAQWRVAQKEFDELRARQGLFGKEISARKSRGEDAADLITEMSQAKARLQELQELVRVRKEELDTAIAYIPNAPHPDTPASLDKADNVVVHEEGNRPHFNFDFRNHVQLGEMHRLFDFERAAKVSGSGFVLYTGDGARLERALLSYLLDRNAAKGYQQIIPPLMVNRQTGFTSGQLPKFADQMYCCTEDDLYVIPTAEIVLGGIYRDEILSAEQLPLKLMAYTPCFRREAGTYGSDERGLIRTHQFNKVELFHFVLPEESYATLEVLRGDAEDLVRGLGLHFRTTKLVTGDLGQSAAMTYDIEVWLPAQNRYYEVSSCSNCEDYQARRGNIRFRREAGSRPELVHMLNGSGLATSRLMVAILENNQQADGTILIPQALQPYMAGQQQIG